MILILIIALFEGIALYAVTKRCKLLDNEVQKYRKEGK